MSRVDTFDNHHVRFNRHLLAPFLDERDELRFNLLSTAQRIAAVDKASARDWLIETDYAQLLVRF